MSFSQDVYGGDTQDPLGQAFRELYGQQANEPKINTIMFDIQRDSSYISPAHEGMFENSLLANETLEDPQGFLFTPGHASVRKRGYNAMIGSPFGDMPLASYACDADFSDESSFNQGTYMPLPIMSRTQPQLSVTSTNLERVPSTGLACATFSLVKSYPSADSLSLTEINARIKRLAACDQGGTPANSQSSDSSALPAKRHSSDSQHQPPVKRSKSSPRFTK